ncbi:hypothetical protein HYPSUDRAFT_63726 [Hypholoma sublateritium FD-334 SS-4]|uniref:Uncharacterized protein n=1 Tax=Hypholoma sublateritium (strain FD-334 SS-4) TaxID=945553 RepID=A0A0D2Q5V7_HYPSF|nr:hypothetical protein HYPSUDRAFT_63726 [Hypholoma sublateritium FD-334 SS-4]
MVERELTDALNLSEQCSDEEVTSSIAGLLMSAVHDANPPKSLADVYHIITTFRATSYLDPLNMIPLLLPCDDFEARNIIALIGNCSSAKEVVMTVQEAMERLERALEREDDDDEKDEAKDEDVLHSRKQNSTIIQFLILIELYSSAIPRIKLRHKTASDTLRPLLDELENVASLASSHSTQNEACDILSSISKLSINIDKWVASNATDGSKDDRATCKAIIGGVLDRSLLICRHGLHTSIAQRTLEKCFPRLASRSATGTSGGSGESAVMEWLDAHHSLGFQFVSLDRLASPSDLIFYAYSPPAPIDLEKLLAFIIPALIASIQTNEFLNESLAVLITYLHAWQTTKPTASLPHDITIPLCGLLPSIASAHLDPSVRHQTFRVLSLLLSVADPWLRFQNLVEYTRDSEYPQMRVAAVGLVKDTLIKSLSSPNAKDDPFCSLLFLRSFGPILFRPDPHDLLSETLTLDQFQETLEPGRLVECLSLYYVLIQRDASNATGIRDKDVQNSIEHTFLSPLRASVERWMATSDGMEGHLHNVTPIISLKICLERVDTAIANISK